MKPNFSVHKIEGTGGGNCTVIPRHVHAHVSFRLVPEQDISDLKQKISRYAREQFDLISARHGRKRTLNKLEVNFKGCAAGWISDPTSDVYKVAERAIERVWGMTPLYIREGGSIPAIRFLEQTFQANAIHIPL